MDTKKILPFIIIAVIFLAGGYFIGKSIGFGQDASIYKAFTPKMNYGMYAWANGPWGSRCIVKATGADASPSRQLNWRACLAPDAVRYPTPEGEIINQGPSIYVVQYGTSLQSKNIVNNGDGTCTVHFSDGHSSKGAPLYGIWDPQFGYGYNTDPSEGIFWACDTTVLVTVSPPASTTNLKPDINGVTSPTALPTATTKTQ